MFSQFCFIGYFVILKLQSEYLLRSYRMPGFHMFYMNCLILIIKKFSKVGILMTPLDEGGFFRLTELNN